MPPHVPKEAKRDSVGMYSSSPQNAHKEINKEKHQIIKKKPGNNTEIKFEWKPGD